jgi:hypothetical protein
MVNLSNLTDEELRSELLRREKERKDQEVRSQRARFATLVANREALLELIPHARTSCSDIKIINGIGSATHGARCSRCALLELNEFDFTNLDFELSLTFKRMDC